MPHEPRRSIMARRNIVTFFLLVAFCAGILAAPCPTDISVLLVVNDTASAMALAEAVNCSGGVFHAEWRGNVVVGHAISIADGTSLNVTGAGMEAVVAGGRGTQLFTVFNASLKVSSIQLRDGTAAVGGAIAANRSSLSFDRTSFIGNVADGDGGGLHLVSSSTVFWGGMSTFVGNTANHSGGAVFIGSDSSVSWGAETSFSDNISGESGGAVYVKDSSNASWVAKTSFSDNTADDSGGAVYVKDTSSVSWGGSTSFSNNTALYGGAMFVKDNSNISWEAEMSFSGNMGAKSGGASYIKDHSSVSWGGKTSFSENTADYGAAIYVKDHSSLSWEAETSFIGNTANESGGAVYVNENSTVSWGGGGSTLFSGNLANFGGGAVYVYGNSVGYWGANTSFVDNHANDGGAVYISGVSSVSWNGTTYFANNTASYEDGGDVPKTYNEEKNAEARRSYIGGKGGAVYVYVRSSVSWKAETTFISNIAAESGGGLRVDGSTASWEAETHFFDNRCPGHGGAVNIGSSVVGIEEKSYLVINATTRFLNNTCEAGGGGMAMTGVASVTFETENVTFAGNSADVAGGAVFVSGAGVGPRFVGVRFVSNSAQVGGGVYVTGSGTAVTVADSGQKQQNPTTFDRCEFIGNEARATGGAVDTGAGLDDIFNTSFVRNTARVGGALRLAGTASLDNCKFVENTSDEREGPAVSNIGYISAFRNSSFVNNTFDCEPGTFLHYNGSRVFIDTVCDKCGTKCTDCHLESHNPSCSEELGHSESAGGRDTVEMLSIESGFWRATGTSAQVLACYNADACLGGVTGASDYCREGYEGPYCSVCSDTYIRSLGFTCNECSNTTDGVVLAVVVAVLAMIGFGLFLSYMLCGETEGGFRGVVARVIPLQSLKIMIVAWQILTQFSSVANITYPDVYQEFLDGIDVVNFDLTWILSTGCIIDVDFHERLLMSTIAPLLGVAVLGATYLEAVRRNRGCDTALDRIRQNHLSMVLLLMFLVYSSVSATLFQMFACDELDDGKTYLRADYRIECDSPRHELLEIYAAFMIVLYTVGIPLYYTILLFTNRDVLTDEIGREANVRVKSTTDLWKPYKPDRFFYEVIECCRRIMLAGVVVFIYPNTAAQIAVTILLVVFFIFVSEALAPYSCRQDAWVNRTGNVIIFLSMYVALLLKLDVSNEEASSQRVFSIILVTAHACMISAVVVEAVALTCSWEAVALTCSWRKETREHLYPRFLRRGDVSVELRQKDDACKYNVDDVENEPNIVR